MKFFEIKKAVNQLLKEHYPKMGLYGKEIREGYQVPCFFTEIIDNGSRAESKNFSRGSFTIKITYFQSKKNELDQLKKIDELKELFELVFLVGNRHLVIQEFSYDYIGEYSDILQVSVDISYYENTKKEEKGEIASKYQLKITNHERGVKDGCTKYYNKFH